MSLDVQSGARLSQERERIGMSQQALSDACGVARNMLSRYERSAAEPGASALVALAGVGIDIGYVLTGRRSQALPELSDMHLRLLQGRGIHWGAGERHSEAHISPAGLAWVLNYCEESKTPLAWSVAGMTRLAGYKPQALRDLYIQVVQLLPDGDRPYPQVLFYLCRTPPFTPWSWSVAPHAGLAQRYELDALSHSLPFDLAGHSDMVPVLCLPDELLAALRQGEVVRMATATGAMQAAAGTGAGMTSDPAGSSVVIHGNVGQKIKGSGTIHVAQTFHAGAPKKSH